MSTGGVVDAVRVGLDRRNHAEVRRTVLKAEQAPPHVTLPALGDAYVNPSYRVATVAPSDLPSTDSWWAGKSVLPNLQGMLLGHLTGAEATAGPLVLLGHPGAGKSASMRVLAAGLPAADFMVVRVELRSVLSDTSIQGQVEQALYLALGEKVAWPELVRGAGSALPVILLDGFDELLQATGLNRADYLEQVVEFQRREAELDRPVAVVVTSRTVVADQARFPDESVVVRLEPFDEPQVTDWLERWNSANAAGLAARSLHPLTADAVLAHGELSRQPLLLPGRRAGAPATQAARQPRRRLPLRVHVVRGDYTAGAGTGILPGNAREAGPGRPEPVPRTRR
jgi:hypothetical protein